MKILSFEEMEKEKWFDIEDRRLKCLRCGGEFLMKLAPPVTCPLCKSAGWRTRKKWANLDDIQETIIDVEYLLDRDGYVRVPNGTHRKVINQIAKIHRLVKSSIIVKHQKRDDVFIYSFDGDVYAILTDGVGRVFVDVESPNVGGK